MAFGVRRSAQGRRSPLLHAVHKEIAQKVAKNAKKGSRWGQVKY